MKSNSAKVVIFIFTNKDKILIEKRQLQDYEGLQYLIPGGHVEEEEEIEEAMKREMLEELGVTPLEYILLPTTKKIAGLKNQTLVPFLINKWEGDLPVTILDKGNAVVWLTIEEVLQTKIKPTWEIVQALKSYLG